LNQTAFLQQGVAKTSAEQPRTVLEIDNLQTCVAGPQRAAGRYTNHFFLCSGARRAVNAPYLCSATCALSGWASADPPPTAALVRALRHGTKGGVLCLPTGRREGTLGSAPFRRLAELVGFGDRGTRDCATPNSTDLDCDLRTIFGARAGFRHDNGRCQNCGFRGILDTAMKREARRRLRLFDVESEHL
jgi:hypothetical protein